MRPPRVKEEKLTPPRLAEGSVGFGEEAGSPSIRRPVVPAPVYQVIGEILAFTSRVDEAWLEEPATEAPVESDGET